MGKNKDMAIRYVIYGLTGWCLEIFWTGMGSIIRGDVNLRGWTYLWMLPIYGLAVFLEPLHEYIRDWPVIFRGMVYTVTIFTVEFFAGLLLKNLIGVCPWDYSRSPYSVEGFIRLDYAPAWFVAGLLFEKMHDFLLKLNLPG